MKPTEVQNIMKNNPKKHSGETPNKIQQQKSNLSNDMEEDIVSVGFDFGYNDAAQGKPPQYTGNLENPYESDTNLDRDEQLKRGYTHGYTEGLKDYRI